MNDHAGVADCIEKYKKDEQFYETNPEEKRQESAEVVMARLDLVGTMITDVSNN
jgi:hypothetical protein